MWMQYDFAFWNEIMNLGNFIFTLCPSLVPNSCLGHCVYVKALNYSILNKCMGRIMCRVVHWMTLGAQVAEKWASWLTAPLSGKNYTQSYFPQGSGTGSSSFTAFPKTAGFKFKLFGFCTHVFISISLPKAPHTYKSPSYSSYRWALLREQSCATSSSIII